MAQLTCQKLCVGYDGKPVLQDLDFEVFVASWIRCDPSSVFSIDSNRVLNSLFLIQCFLNGLNLFITGL